MATTDSNTPNSLGLDFDQDEQKEPERNTSPHPDSTPQEDQNSAFQGREKKKPYVNPERVKTGGTQRVSVELYFLVRVLTAF